MTAPKSCPDSHGTAESQWRHPTVRYDSARNVWCVSRYAEVVQVVLDSECFSSRPASFEVVFGGADGAPHRRVRRIVGQGFTAARTQGLVQPLREFAHAAARRLAATGEGEWIGDFARPLSAVPIVRMLGLENPLRERLADWSAAFIRGTDPAVSGPERAACDAQMSECRAFIADRIARLAGGAREPSVLPFLTGNDGPDGLTFAEQVEIGTLLVVAGIETTARLIGNATLLLLQRPEWRSRLKTDAALIPPFVEEVLRYESPVQRTYRVTTRPTEIAGVPIPEGAMVELLIGSANRDPEKFLDPDEFQPGREPNQHIGFGFGRHFCIGAAIAHAEAAIALETFLSFPEAVRVRPEDAIDFGAIPSLRGPVRLDLRFTSLVAETSS